MYIYIYLYLHIHTYKHTHIHTYITVRYITLHTHIHTYITVHYSTLHYIHMYCKLLIACYSIYMEYFKYCILLYYIMTHVLLETPFDRSHRKFESSTTRDELHKLDGFSNLLYLGGDGWWMMGASVLTQIHLIFNRRYCRPSMTYHVSTYFGGFKSSSTSTHLIGSTVSCVFENGEYAGYPPICHFEGEKTIHWLSKCSSLRKAVGLEATARQHPLRPQLTESWTNGDQFEVFLIGKPWVLKRTNWPFEYIH
jgi:hypothetical protein